MAVEGFLATRGESRLVTLRTERDQASANLAFESAAPLHAQVQRVEAVRALAAELVRPLSRLRGVILQASANPDEVAVFPHENGRLRVPVGSRARHADSERAVGLVILFAQPMAVEPIPEATEIRDQRSENTEPQVGNSAAEAQAEARESHAPVGSSHAAFSRAGLKRFSPCSPRLPGRPRPPSARAISLSSSAGTTGLRPSARARFSFRMRKNSGRRERFCGGSDAWRRNRLLPQRSHKQAGRQR